MRDVQQFRIRRMCRGQVYSPGCRIKSLSVGVRGLVNEADCRGEGFKPFESRVRGLGYNVSFPVQVLGRWQIEFCTPWSLSRGAIITTL